MRAPIEFRYLPIRTRRWTLRMLPRYQRRIILSNMRKRIGIVYRDIG